MSTTTITSICDTIVQHVNYMASIVWVATYFHLDPDNNDGGGSVSTHDFQHDNIYDMII